MTKKRKTRKIRNHDQTATLVAKNKTENGPNTKDIISADVSQRVSSKKSYSAARMETSNSTKRCSSTNTTHEAEIEDRGDVMINDLNAAQYEDSPSRQSAALEKAEHSFGRISALSNRTAVTHPTTRSSSAMCLNAWKHSGLDREYSAQLSRNNSAGLMSYRIKSAAQERTSSHTDTHREHNVRRHNSAFTISDRSSRNNSAIRNHSPVYVTDERRGTSDNERENTLEDEIVKGSRLSGPPMDTSDIKGIHSPRSKPKELLAKDNDISVAPDVLGELAMTDRNDLHSRGSSLMLGSGKVRKLKNTETLELHFDNEDYSNLVDQRSSHDVFSVTIGTTATITPTFSNNVNKLSPRTIELPKTYITKAGSLLLYSDSKVIKDKLSQIQISSQNEKDSIEVKGRTVTPRTLVPQAYPFWGKFLNRRKPTSKNTERLNTGRAKKDQLEYLGITSQTANTKPYSWEYAVLPEKIIDENDEADIKTVSSLSEAVLAYRSSLPTSEDKYLSIMKRTRDGKTQAERMNEAQARNLNRMSAWTREWVGVQNSLKDNQNAGVVLKDFETDNVLIARLRNSFRQSLRTPANTPSVSSNPTLLKQSTQIKYLTEISKHDEV